MHSKAKQSYSPLLLVLLVLEPHFIHRYLFFFLIGETGKKMCSYFIHWRGVIFFLLTFHFLHEGVYIGVLIFFAFIFFSGFFMVMRKI